MYKEFVSPILDKLDSETWHIRAREAIHLAESNRMTLRLLEFFADKHTRFSDPRLTVIVGGVSFENPLIVGAGWDKEGRAVGGLFQLGFAGVEVGSILAYPQDEDEKKRQWLVGEGVVFNRLGFNSSGSANIAYHMQRDYGDCTIPIGINIGINKFVSDKEAPLAYAVVVEEMFGVASYFVVNVSSPNTPGLRKLQAKPPLSDIVVEVNEAIADMAEYTKTPHKPLFIKIAPDLENSEVDDVIEVVIENDIAGIIATNTTNSEQIKAKYGRSGEVGGISGNDEQYRAMSTEKVRHIYRQTRGSIDIIGVGGINSAESALEKIKYGARAVQIVTGIRQEGPSLPGRINRGLIGYIEQEGYSSINDVVGVNVPGGLLEI